MKNLTAFAIACFAAVLLNAQDQVDVYIKDAQNMLAQKQYRQAQLSLQDAINEINNLISAQIGEMMPEEINGLKSTGSSSNSAAMGMMGGGIQITKSYQNPSMPENEAEVTIMANSPMLATMAMYLSNPAMLGPEYKSVRVGTQRAILKSEMTESYDDNGNSKQIRSSELQIPLDQTLITIELKGFASEQAELDFVNKLGIDKLKEMLAN